MKTLIYILVLVLVGIVNVQSSLVESGYQDACPKESADTLGSRVSKSDVVLTATIVRIETENPGSVESSEIDVDSELVKSSDERFSSRTVAYVKLWRVVKGSLSEVSNHTSGPSDLLSDESVVSNSGIESPIVKLYGLWNDRLCGSYLSIGDTRVFFLRKFRDVRELNEKDLDDEVTKSETSKIMSLAPSDDLMKDSLVKMREETTTQTTATTKKPKKNKNKGTGMKKKKRDRKNKKKNGITAKSGRKPRKPKSKRKKRKRRKTESVRGELERLSKRHKRSSGLPNEVSRMSDREVKVRRQIETDPRSVLVLISSPARITLANLNSVEDLSKR